MPRRFFRQFRLNRESLKDLWWLAPFKRLIGDPNLWAIRRRNVVPAVAIGLFVAYLPFPGHTLTAALLAIMLQANVPISIVSTLVSNPLTMGPMFYLGYETGRLMLGMPAQPFEFEMSFAWLADRLATTWQPLLLGCLVLGTVLATIGYVGLDLLWRASISDYLARRRQRRQTQTIRLTIQPASVARSREPGSGPSARQSSDRE